MRNFRYQKNDTARRGVNIFQRVMPPVVVRYHAKEKSKKANKGNALKTWEA